MALEVGTSVIKFGAMMIGGIGSLYLISVGHYEAGIAILSGLVAFAIGEQNGKKIAQRYVPEAPKGYLTDFTNEELIEYAQERDAGERL
jgi:hypothetical protein